MRRWRSVLLLLAVAAFLLAAIATNPGSAGSESGIVQAFSLQVGSAAFFWLGVLCFLVAAWRWGGT